VEEEEELDLVEEEDVKEGVEEAVTASCRLEEEGEADSHVEKNHLRLPIVTD